MMPVPTQLEDLYAGRQPSVHTSQLGCPGALRFAYPEDSGTTRVDRRLDWSPG